MNARKPCGSNKCTETMRIEQLDPVVRSAWFPCIHSTMVKTTLPQGGGVLLLGSNLGGVGPERGLRGGGRRGGVKSRPGSARTILLSHIISARPSKQSLMVRTFLKVYMEFNFYFLFLQEQIKDIIFFNSFHPRDVGSQGVNLCYQLLLRRARPKRLGRTLRRRHRLCCSIRFRLCANESLHLDYLRDIITSDGRMRLAQICFFVHTDRLHSRRYSRLQPSKRRT